MGLFGKFKKEESVQIVDTGYQSFSTPFLKVPSSNLSLPFIDERYQSRGYVPFGEDNLYPQYLNQMYYTSPLHSAITNYKVNAVCGGGYDMLDDGLTAKEKVDAYFVDKKIQTRKYLKPVLLDIIIHGRVYFIVTIKSGKAVKYERVGAEKVRVNKDKSVYSVNSDWQYVAKIETYLPYRKGCADGVYMYCYENICLGQDIYPIPSYTSAMNWIFLDGEMSYLHKANIQNSVFPSFAMLFPKKPQSPEEQQLIKDTINKMKGAENAGKAVAFFANNKESLPELVTVPTNSNDNLFIQTDGRIDEKICQAHEIDPLIMGIRVSGKLGSGMELEQSYQTFEKNQIMPLREDLEWLFNDLYELGGSKAQFTCVEYRIIGDTIVDSTQTKRDEI